MTYKFLHKNSIILEVVNYNRYLVQSTENQINQWESKERQE